MRDRLIAAGIRNLREFGYPDVNATNILTDMIYSKMFLGMLKETLKNTINGRVVWACDDLIDEIERGDES